jgi:hypothetical protein
MNDNFLKETIDSMKPYTPRDVLYVMIGDAWTTWDEFARVADFTYNSGYGSELIHGRLLVVGEGWWLERADYDGAEWWDLKKTKTKPETHLPKLKRRDLLRPSILDCDWAKEKYLDEIFEGWEEE